MRKISRLITILSGSILAQAISLISLLFITKLYEPLEYGQFAALILLHSAALPLVLLRLETFLIVSQGEDIIGGAFKYSINIIKRLTLISALVFFLLFLVMPGNKYIIPQLFIVILVSFVTNVVNSILYYHSQPQLVAYSSVIQALITGLCQVLFSIFSTSSQSLLIAFVIGRVVGTAPFIFYTRRNLNRNFKLFSNKVFEQINIKTQHFDYKWSQIFAFFESILNLIPVFLCVFVFNSDSLGALMLIIVIISGPANMLVSSLTLTELTSSKLSSAIEKSSFKAIEYLSFLTNSRFAAIFYFLSMSFIAVALRGFGILNTDLILFSTLVLAFAIQVASTNDFAFYVAQSKWILLAKIYLVCFSISALFTTTFLLTFPNNTLLVLTSFYLTRSFTLFLTLLYLRRKK